MFTKGKKPEIDYIPNAIVSHKKQWLMDGIFAL
jgi:hypothetical protein